MEALIETEDLKKYFKTPKGMLHAVDGINLSISQGKTLGVVGESGCGKSTLGRVMLRLLDATSGKVLYRGENILEYKGSRVRDMRKKLQIIFQDPYSALNPRMTVGQLVAEPMIVNKVYATRSMVREKVAELMDLAGLSKRLVNTYPHELDGGRRQRVGITRALSVNPEFVVCDEPVSALDVSIQAQILNLMISLQEEIGLTYMFISHDLSVVKHMSDDIAVMYLGQCVEYASSKDLFEHTMHPYTKALLESIPIADLDTVGTKRETLKGEVQSPINPAPGCRFMPRCKYATEKCKEPVPYIGIRPGHFVACHLYD